MLKTPWLSGRWSGSRVGLLLWTWDSGKLRMGLGNPNSPRRLSSPVPQTHNLGLGSSLLNPLLPPHCAASLLCVQDAGTAPSLVSHHRMGLKPYRAWKPVLAKWSYGGIRGWVIMWRIALKRSTCPMICEEKKRDVSEDDKCATAKKLIFNSNKLKFIFNKWKFQFIITLKFIILIFFKAFATGYDGRLL